MVEAKKSAALVMKKKKWVSILAPKIFRETEIGQIYVEETEQAVGRTIKISLMIITGEPSKQNTKVEFRITGKTKEGQLTTEPLGYELNVTGMKKFMRRGRTKLQDSLVMETADHKKIRIKPVVVTRNEILSGTKKELRRRMNAFLTEQITKMTFENIIADLASRKLQKAGEDLLRKLCPIYALDIGSIRIVVEHKEKDEKKE